MFSKSQRQPFNSFVSFARVSSAIVETTKDQENIASATHGDFDGDGQLSLAMNKCLEGRMEAAKITLKYFEVARKIRKTYRALQKVWLSRGISSNFIVRGCPSVSPYVSLY